MTRKIGVENMPCDGLPTTAHKTLGAAVLWILATRKHKLIGSPSAIQMYGLYDKEGRLPLNIDAMKMKRLFLEKFYCFI